jgi:hypothetical protein
MNPKITNIITAVKRFGSTRPKLTMFLLGVTTGLFIAFIF